MDESALIARDTALLQKAGSISSQKSYILLFVIAALMGLTALVAVAAGGLWGGIMLGFILAFAAVATKTGLGESLIVGVVAVISSGVAAVALTAVVYGVLGH